MEILKSGTIESSQDILVIDSIVRKFTTSIEGNCIYTHKSNLKPYGHGNCDIKLTLRKNLYILAKNAENLVEIGLNGGHSIAVFFLANPNLKVLSFDICEHNYVENIADYYKNKYNFEFVKGNSLTTVKSYDSDKKYDVIHIDGGHDIECVENDLINCKKFAHEKSFLIFDDSHAPHIQRVLNVFCEKNFITEVNYTEHHLEKCHFHRIFRYIL